MNELLFYLKISSINFIHIENIFSNFQWFRGSDFGQLSLFTSPAIFAMNNYLNSEKQFILEKN